MALTIWKYPLTPFSLQNLSMPAGSRLLHVAEQDGSLCLWALVNPHPEVPKVEIKVAVVGTGHPVPDEFDHLGTVLTFDGSLVWHVMVQTKSSVIPRSQVVQL